MLPYQSVRRYVLEQMSSGIWKPGERIPPEVKLAERLSVHRLTVNRVLNDLAREGMLQRRRGAGTVVCDPKRPSKKSAPGKGLVGLVTGHPFDPVQNNFYGVIFEILRTRLESAGLYLLPLGYADDFFQKPDAPLNPSLHLAAVALLGAPANDSAIALLERCGIPAAVIGVSEYTGPLPSVATDDWNDSTLIAERLSAAGHRKIVHLNARPPYRMHDRLEGFLAGCDKTDTTIPFRYIVDAPGLEIQDGTAALRQFLQHDLPFTAVFAGSDNLALGALHALTEAGIRVPQDVSIVGFDGTDLAIYGTPRLATMRVSRRRLASRAADVLAALATGAPIRALHTKIPSRWIEGATFAAGPAAVSSRGKASGQTPGKSKGQSGIGRA